MKLIHFLLFSPLFICIIAPSTKAGGGIPGDGRPEPGQDFPRPKRKSTFDEPRERKKLMLDALNPGLVDPKNAQYQQTLEKELYDLQSKLYELQRTICDTTENEKLSLLIYDFHQAMQHHILSTKAELIRSSKIKDVRELSYTEIPKNFYTQHIRLLQSLVPLTPPERITFLTTLKTLYDIAIHTWYGKHIPFDFPFASMLTMTGTSSNTPASLDDIVSVMNKMIILAQREKELLGAGEPPAGSSHSYITAVSDFFFKIPSEKAKRVLDWTITPPDSEVAKYLTELRQKKLLGLDQQMVITSATIDARDEDVLPALQKFFWLHLNDEGSEYLSENFIDSIGEYFSDYFKRDPSERTLFLKELAEDFEEEFPIMLSRLLQSNP